MSNINIFERATRNKLRFATNRGQLSVEEIWDLSLTSLDVIAKAVNKQLKEEDEESFIGKKTSKSSDNSLRLEVLKYVIGVKMEEADKASARAANREQRRFLEGLLEKKKLDKLEGMSLEEIQAQLAAIPDNE